MAPSIPSPERSNETRAMATVSEPEAYGYPFSHGPLHLRPPTPADFFYANSSRAFGSEYRLPGMPFTTAAAGPWLPLVVSQSASAMSMPPAEAEEIPENSSVETEGVTATPYAESPEQLTLIYKGEQFSFEAVDSDKLRAVLMLLNSEVKKEKADVQLVSSQAGASNKGSLSPVDGSLAAKQVYGSHFSNRHASLMRFREKKKGRTFNKKIRYEVRKQVAKRMVRIKGRFAPYNHNEAKEVSA